jgi:hypothetical protein
MSNLTSEPGTPISGLPPASSSLFTDIFPVDQGGSTYTETLLQVGTLFGFNPVTHSLNVAAGGTGNLTFTPYALLCAGTTATGAFQNVVGLGLTGYVLTSNGPGFLPTWNAVTSSGIVNPGLINQLTYYASAGTTVSGLSTANNGTLITGATGIPSISTTLPQAVQLNITSVGTITTGTWNGNVLGVTYGGTGVANPTAYTLPVAAGSSNFSFLGPLTNGQLLIGSTGTNPSAAVITSGTNISVTNGAGSITIAATGNAGFVWTTVTGTSQTLASNNGYIANNAGLVTFTLPVTSLVGDKIEIIGKGAGGWSVVFNSGQYIIFGSATCTTTSGSLSSTLAKNSFTMVCTVANTEWTVASSIGNLTAA